MPPRARASSSTSTAASASKKRKPTSAEGEEEAPPPPTPSTSYFVADGNVLLHVGSILFKVHRGVLEKAEVFADTLWSGRTWEGRREGYRRSSSTTRRRIGCSFSERCTTECEFSEALSRALDDEDLTGYSYASRLFSEKLPTLSQTHSPPPRRQGELATSFPFPSFFPSRLLTLSLLSQYNHTSIFSGAKGSFLARCKYESSLEERPSAEECPYGHDEEFASFSNDTVRALLVLQERFGLDPTSVRYIHNYLALHNPSRRADFLHDYDLDSYPDWFPLLVSKESRASVLSLPLLVLSLSRVVALNRL